MQLEPGKISSTQAVYLLFMAIVGTASLELPGAIVQQAGRDGWAAVVLTSLMTLLPGALWIWAASYWPGKDMFELVTAAGGRVAGLAVNLILVVWIYTLVTGAAFIGADLLILNFLPETPRWIVVASIVGPAAMAAHSRLEVVARFNQLVFWSIVALVVTYMPLSAQEAQFERLQPMLTASPRGLFTGAVASVGILAESFVLISILPYLNGKARPWRLLFWVTGTVCVFMALLSAWVVTVFGPMLPARFHHPILKLSHIISIADVFERLDALVIVLWVAGVVSKVAFWYWMLCLGVARTFGLKDDHVLVWPLVPLVAVGSINWATQSNEYDTGLQSWTTLTFALIGCAIPLGVVVLSQVKRLLGRGKAG